MRWHIKICCYSRHHRFAATILLALLSGAPTFFHCATRIRSHNFFIVNFDYLIWFCDYYFVHKIRRASTDIEKFSRHLPNHTDSFSLFKMHTSCQVSIHSAFIFCFRMRVNNINGNENNEIPVFVHQRNGISLCPGSNRDTDTTNSVRMRN